MKRTSHYLGISVLAVIGEFCGMKNIYIKKHAGISVLLLVCAVSSTQCKKNSSNPALDPAANTTPSVYVAGYELDASGTLATAEYWKNGTGVKLTDGKNLALGISIAVSGNDIYVAGAELINSIAVAKYWKNGTAVILSGGVNPASANSIAIDGNDVYVCGYEQNINTNIFTAKYWKNGVASNLSYPNRAASIQAQSITVTNGDVYIAGTVNDNGKQTAVYWKNGTPVTLGDGITNSGASSIAVDPQNHVFVAGDVTASGNAPNYADYWSDGALNSLHDGTNYCTSNNIKAIAGNIYVAGLSQVGTGRKYAAYWKNSIVTKFSDGSSDAEALGMDVNGNDVYGSGDITQSNGRYAPVYWKNNVMVNLPTTGNNGGQAYSIVVK